MLDLLGLALGSPLGCLILASILKLVTLLLGLVNGRLGVLGGCVDGKQAQGSRSGVDDYRQPRLRPILTVVLGPLGNNDHITSLDFLLLSSDHCLADTRSEDQVLIDRMDLFSDIPSNRDGHDDQLRALAGPEDISELGVLRWNGVDSLEMLHLLGRGRHVGVSILAGGKGSDRCTGDESSGGGTGEGSTG